MDIKVQDLTKKFKNYLCIIGDGSFLMNIQDLQNISEFNEKILILLVLYNHLYF